MSNTQRGWIWLAAGLGAAYFGWTNRRLFFVNDITTGESAAYPALRSRVYYVEISQAMTAAEQALSRLPGWKVLSQDAENDLIEASAKSVLGADDVTIYFFSLGLGQVRVTIRSRAQNGLGDLGRNAAHIRQLQAAMDDRLDTGAAF